MDEGAGAHDAGFEGDVKGGLPETVVGGMAGGGAEKVDFSVSGGVVSGDGSVVSAGDDFAVDYENGADGNFAFGFGAIRLFDGGAHKVFVIHENGGNLILLV